MISSGELYFLIWLSKSKQIMLLVLTLLVSLKKSCKPCASAFSMCLGSMVITK